MVSSYDVGAHPTGNFKSLPPLPQTGIEVTELGEKSTIERRTIFILKLNESQLSAFNCAFTVLDSTFNHIYVQNFGPSFTFLIRFSSTKTRLTFEALIGTFGIKFTRLNFNINFSLQTVALKLHVPNRRKLFFRMLHLPKM